MPDRATLAKIHIAVKELQLTDENYRDILYFNFGAQSAKDLTDKQAAGLLDFFRRKGWKPKRGNTTPGKRKRDGQYISITPGPAAAQQKKVLAMWNALGYGMDKLHARVKKQFGVERFEWLTDHKALHILITDLDERQRAREKKR